MGDAHYIEELGEGEIIATLHDGPVPRERDEFMQEVDGHTTRYRVDSVAWVEINGLLWARIYVERVTTA